MKSKYLKVITSLIKGMPLRSFEIFGSLFPDDSWGCRVRGALYRPYLKKCGKDFQVSINAKLEHLNGIEIGDNVYIGYSSWISGLRGGIVISDDVIIGPFVCIVSSNHTFKNGSARFGKGKGGKIFIGKGCWIASGVTITAGVSIGESCLIAAGAVVTHDVNDGEIVAGVPAKCIGTTSSLKDD